MWKYCFKLRTRIYRGKKNQKNLLFSKNRGSAFISHNLLTFRSWNNFHRDLTESKCSIALKTTILPCKLLQAAQPVPGMPKRKISILSRTKALLTVQNCSKQHWYSSCPSHLLCMSYATHFIQIPDLCII